MFAPELSRTAGIPAGMRFGSLATAATEHADVVGRYLGKLADPDTRAFAALNTAFTNDGAYVYIPEGADLRAADADAVRLDRRGIRADNVAPARARGRRRAQPGADRRDLRRRPVAQKHFTNAVTEIVAGENAVIDHYKVQQESIDAFHIASMHINAARSATSRRTSFTLGGRIVRNDIDRRARRRRRRVHAERPVPRRRRAAGGQPHDDRSRQGALPEPRDLQGHPRRPGARRLQRQDHRPQDAQKTDAKQTNRALLLSDNASINTKPQLEIFADDVKCTHGAAIGQLDEDAMFYLRARGLTYFEARDMLIHAFAGDILDRVKIEPLRVALEAELYAQLAQGSRGARRGMTHGRRTTAGRTGLDVAQVRADFPILGRQVHGKPLVYLDNAATTQKPQARDRRDLALLHRATTPTSIAACIS